MELCLTGCLRDLAHVPERIVELFGAHVMDPRVETGAPVSYANTYADVADHVAFGVDPPFDRDFFLPLVRVVCLTGFDRQITLELQQQRIVFVCW